MKEKQEREEQFFTSSLANKGLPSPAFLPITMAKTQDWPPTTTPGGKEATSVTVTGRGAGGVGGDQNKKMGEAEFRLIQ